jgi:hypothetical protein
MLREYIEYTKDQPFEDELIVFLIDYELKYGLIERNIYENMKNENLIENEF